MQQEHASLIDGLGGGAALAKLLWGNREGERDRRAERIYMWKKNGIPWRWRTTVARIAADRGVEVPPGFLEPAHEDISSGQAAQ